MIAKIRTKTNPDILVQEESLDQAFERTFRNSTTARHNNSKMFQVTHMTQPNGNVVRFTKQR